MRRATGRASGSEILRVRTTPDPPNQLGTARYYARVYKQLRKAIVESGGNRHSSRNIRAVLYYHAADQSALITNLPNRQPL